MLTSDPKTIKTICKDRQQKREALSSRARGSSSVSSDIDKLLEPKSYEQLETLEFQIKKKLNSNEPIDYDYWEQLLKSLVVWKAKAKLRRVSKTIVTSRLKTLQKQQSEDAQAVAEKLQKLLASGSGLSVEDGVSKIELSQNAQNESSRSLDPEPFLKLRPEDKALETIDEKDFLDKIVSDQSSVFRILV